jgi:hypothetical protein
MVTQRFFGTDGTPLRKPEDVIPFLGKGEAHWNKERSAYQTAHSWFNANGLPPGIRDILRTDPSFTEVELEKAIFERKTKLDSYGRESQTDVLAHVLSGSNIAVVGVEAKVDESFGPFVSDWNDYTPGKLKRLAGLIERLELKSEAIGSLRYQLFHRTAATLIEAEQIKAHDAALIVQSFDQGREGYKDFAAFAAAFGTPIEAPGRLSRPKKVGDITMRLGWTENPKFYAEGN